MKKKQISVINLIHLDWKNLIRSKSFWVGILLAAFGIYNGQLELVIGAGALITLRDSINK